MASRELLTRLEGLYPKSSTSHGALTPWYIVAAAAFSASNLPEAVPDVYKYVNEGLETDEERLLVTRKMRDGIFKSGMTSGYSRAINALIELNAVVPDQFRDKETLRDTTRPITDIERNGQEYFNHTYGDTAGTVQPFLKEIYPDLEYFSTTIAYGWAYGFFGVTSPIETSFSMVAALISLDTPRQAAWHLQGAMRNGATLQEVKAVREISIVVATEAGIKWKNEIPDVHE